MDRPSYAPVVDQMISELTSRRQVHAAYLALARAILADDVAERFEPSERDTTLAA
jgi:hypothetical protein